MVTKPLKEFVDNKVKGYVHWDVEEWIFIREQAKQRNIPAHWVIKEMRNFLTSSSAIQEEFKRYLEEKYPKRALRLKEHPILVCDVCGQKYTDPGLLFTHKRKSHPLEVLAR